MERIDSNRPQAQPLRATAVPSNPEHRRNPTPEEFWASDPHLRGTSVPMGPRQIRYRTSTTRTVHMQ